MKSAFVFALSFIFISQTHALDGGASGVGRGETFLVLPDDTVVVADPFAERTPRLTFSPDLEGIDYKIPNLVRFEFERIKDLFYRYSGKRGTHPRFFEEYVVDPPASRRTYLIVKELPKGCDAMRLSDQLPPGAISHVYMCTHDWTTYILESFFEKKVSVREWAKALLHERLHAFAPIASHDLITDIVSGMGILLEYYDRQLKGERPVLSESEVSSIRSFIESSAALGIMNLLSAFEEFFEKPSQSHEKSIANLTRRFLSEYEVTAQGGGLVHREAQVGAHLYAGIGSLIRKSVNTGSNVTLIDAEAGGKIGAGSSILYTDLPGVGEIGDRVRIERSYFQQVSVIQIAEDSEILEAYLPQTNHLRMGRGSKLIKSSIWANEIQLGSGSSIVESNLHFAEDAYKHPKTDQTLTAALKLGENSTIQKVRMGPFTPYRGGTYFVLGAYYKMEPGSISFQLGNRVTLSNWREKEGKISSREKAAYVGILPVYDRIIEPSLSIADGTTIDLKGSGLCSSTEFHWVGKLKLEASHNSIADLRNLLCSESEETRPKKAKKRK